MTKLRYKKIAGCIIILFIAILFCLIQIILPNKSYTYERSSIFTQDTMIQTGYTIFDQIALSPGVYELRIDYYSDEDLKSIFNVKDGTVFYGGLLSIGEFLYQNKPSTDFYIWLLESTEQLEITLQYGGGYVEIESVTIVETNLLWTMLLTIFLFCIGVLLLVRYYLECDRKGQVSKEQKSALFGVGLIILIASLPYMQPGLTSGADLGYHLHRIEGIKTSILTGQFPVRIEPHWLYNHGYANAIFYCPFFLYLPGILRILGFTMGGSYAIYCCFINILTAIISYYSFSKIFKDRRIGVICCGLYTLSIFRIYKMYITAAAGEAGAVTFMPLVLYGFYRLFTEDIKSREYRTVWIPLSLGFSGLIQTHVLSCEITALLAIIACVVFCKKVFRKETFLQLVKGASMTAGLTLWYLVPFLDFFIREDLHIHYVSARTIQDRGLYFEQLFHHFWQSGSNAVLGEAGMYDSHPVGLGFVLAAGVCIFGVMWFCRAWNQEKHLIISFGKVALLFSILLMWMSLSIFPWDTIQNLSSITASLVSSIQFPNRFLGWGSTFSIAVFGCCLWFFWQKKSKIAYYGMVILAIAGITTSSMYLTDDMFSTATFQKLYNEEGGGYGYISGEEYLPQGVNSPILLYNEPITGENVDLMKYEKDYLEIHMECVNSGKSSSYIDVPLLRYTGYQAVDKETGDKLEIQTGENGIVRVVLPAGYAGAIYVSFVSPIYWRISEIISLVCICLFVPLCCRSRRREDKNA